jgi:hypothetical protein
LSFVRQSLVRDGSLVLSIDRRLLHAASHWMPSLPVTQEAVHPDGAAILVDVGEVARMPPWVHRKPDLRLGSTDCWKESGADSAFIQNDDRTMTASLDLDRRVAHVVAAAQDVEPRDMTSVLTLAAALLLLRDRRTPIHAGAVAPAASSSVWLLLGDSHSGKSTTTANLVKAGWSYLSDDYVVLSGKGGLIMVEGWPEDFHVDEGWSRGESTGIRATLPESSLPRGARTGSGVLGGLFFTRIEASEPTRLTPISSASALERLIRQTPWLMADPTSAPGLLDLLGAASSLPAGEIRLGLDTYRDAELLSQIVSEFEDRSRGAPR